MLFDHSLEEAAATSQALSLIENNINNTVMTPASTKTIDHSRSSPAAVEQSRNTTPDDIAYEPTIQLYYQNFHRSHPFLVPRKFFHTPLRHRIPHYLLAIMRYIGAHFHNDPSFAGTFRGPAYAALSDSNPRDGYKVQSMLLLAIADHADGFEDRAYQTIRDAVSLALELGMNHPSFARKNSGGSSVLEESWRRTYWELYIVTGLFAALRPQQNVVFLLDTPCSDLPLPCDETIYNAAEVLFLSLFIFVL